MDTFDCGCDNRANNMSCSDMNCSARSTFPCKVSLAMAYVPFQQWEEVYCAEKGFAAGTLFPCLNLPFMGCSR